MIGMLVALMLLSWIFGRTRGLIGGLAGGFVGALVVAGMTAATSNGELAALYSPGRLASVAVPAAVVAAVAAPTASLLAPVGDPRDRAGAATETSSRHLSAGPPSGGDAGPPEPESRCRPSESRRAVFMVPDGFALPNTRGGRWWLQAARSRAARDGGDDATRPHVSAIHALGDPAAVVSAQPGEHLQVRLPGQRRIERGRFDQRTDPMEIGGRPADRVP